MRPLDNENAGAAIPGVSKAVRSATDVELPPDTRIARREQLLAELEIIARWQQGSVNRLQAAERLFETYGLDPYLHDALIAEAEALVALMAIMRLRVPGRLGDPTPGERIAS